MGIQRIVILAVVLSAGCMFMPQPESPDTTRLQFTGDGAAIVAAEPTGLTLLVVPPRALPAYSTHRFAYMQQDRELRYYARHEWIADPARMLHPALVRALEQGGRFAAVVVPPTPATADVRLDLEILELHQDFRAGDPSEFVWRVRAQVVVLDERRVVGTRVFEVRERAGGNAVAGAAAADRALARLLEDLTGFIAGLPLD